MFVFQADTTGTLYRTCFMVCKVILEGINIAGNISYIVTGGFALDLYPPVIRRRQISYFPKAYLVFCDSSLCD